MTYCRNLATRGRGRGDSAYYRALRAGTPRLDAIRLGIMAEVDYLLTEGERAAGEALRRIEDLEP